MGVIIRTQDISSQQAIIQKPLIFVNPEHGMMEKAVSINRKLAEALQPFTFKKRTMRMQQILQKIIGELPEDSIICEFDAMFHPEYRIDVLQTLIAACRTKPFSVIWPGTYEDGKLIYAEEGRPDYKVYEIANYDITCVR